MVHSKQMQIIIVPILEFIVFGFFLTVIEIIVVFKLYYIFIILKQNILFYIQNCLKSTFTIKIQYFIRINGLKFIHLDIYIY